MVCPTGVKIAEMNARARASMVQQGKIPMRLRLRNNMVARSELIGKLAQPVAPLANAVFKFPTARIAAEKFFAIHRHAPFPVFARQKFSTWFSRHQKASNLCITNGIKPRIAYFTGCSTQYYEPRIGQAAVRVLEANGFEVIVPPQNCCGLPLLSNGEFAAARRYHASNVGKLITYAREGIPIVGTSTSCTLTLKEEAPELLDMYDPDTQAVADNTYDFNEFLLLLLESGRLNLDFQPVALELPYHVPCQYKAHRLGRPGIEILQLIPGLRITESEAACCGIAGTYGYKLEKYDISMRVGADLFDFVNKSQAPAVICDSETCRWQITHATGIPAIHPVELIAAAYRLPVTDSLARIFASRQPISS